MLSPSTIAPDQDVLAAIPRHPADPNIAYGENLDRLVITDLVKRRILMGAIFRKAVSPDEIAKHATLDVQKAFRDACLHFTHFFVTRREKGYETDIDQGIAVMRGLGVVGQTFDIEHGHVYEGGKNLSDFFPDNWLFEKIREHGKITARMGEYGYHIFQAFPEMANDGYYGTWHTHQDINAHLTLSGAGLEWLPGDISLDDAKKHPERYNDRIQRIEIGDLAVFGEIIHRSSHKIPEQGQFAILAHGPYDLTGGN